MSSRATPLSDDLGNKFFTGGRNPKGEKRREKKEEQQTFIELDEAHWRIVSIYGRQDAEEG